MTMIAILAAVFAVLYVAGVFNRLVSRRNHVRNTFALMDVHLKQRCDLIPNLVASVKKYMAHESTTFERIAALRSQAMSDTTSPAAKIGAQQELGRLMHGIAVQLEAYPELQAAGNIRHLMRTMNELEEQIAAARRCYNMAVTEYNTAIEIFPQLFFARLFGFTAWTLFEITEQERKAPDANALFG